MLQEIVDAVPAPLVVVDDAGAIVALNAGWRCFARDGRFGRAWCRIGSRYLDLWREVTCAADFARLAAGLHAVIEGKARQFEVLYPYRTKQGSRSTRMRGRRLAIGHRRHAVIANEDVAGTTTEVADDVQQLAIRLAAQEDERRRIARELHDTTAQDLVAASMTIDRAQREPSDAVELDEAKALIDKSLQEIRTLSYLLHPPLLDEMGLATALKQLVHGFERRSGIAVALHLPRLLERLPPAIEDTLYRVVQEALANVHRHAGCATAEVRLAQSSRETCLEVRDRGRGLPGDATAYGPDDITQLGVGISGLRARLRQLGSNLNIHSRGPGMGTVVTATVPRSAAQGIAGK